MTITTPSEAHLASTDAASSPVTAQPTTQQAMNYDTQAKQSTTPQEEETQARLQLRGGGEMCPGRFCFIIPCPIPCDFCCI